MYSAKNYLFLKTLTNIKVFKSSEHYKTTAMLKNLLFGLAGLCLFSSSLLAQTPQTAEKKKIKVQMYIDGKLHPSNQTFTKADNNIQIKAYDASNNRELAVALVEASLIRNGQKIATIKLPGNGSIEKLAAKAKNNDNYMFEIKQILELADDLSLKPFSEKSFKVNYWFFDAELDAAKVAVGTN